MNRTSGRCPRRRAVWLIVIVTTTISIVVEKIDNPAQGPVHACTQPEYDASPEDRGLERMKNEVKKGPAHTPIPHAFFALDHRDLLHPVPLFQQHIWLLFLKSIILRLGYLEKQHNA
jgi:hypothetical protein